MVTVANFLVYRFDKETVTIKSNIHYRLGFTSTKCQLIEGVEENNIEDSNSFKQRMSIINKNATPFNISIVEVAQDESWVMKFCIIYQSVKEYIEFIQFQTNDILLHDEIAAFQQSHSSMNVQINFSIVRISLLF